MIPTAEDFSNKYDMTYKQMIAMIEFAKLHVEAALKEAYTTCNNDRINILKSYPITNIK